MILRGLVPILCILGATLTGSGSDSDPGSASVLVESPMARAHVLDDSSTLPSTPRSLPFFYDLHTFRTDGGGTTVVAAIAVAAVVTITIVLSKGVRLGTAPTANPLAAERIAQPVKPPITERMR